MTGDVSIGITPLKLGKTVPASIVDQVSSFCGTKDGTDAGWRCDAADDSPQSAAARPMPARREPWGGDGGA